MISKVTKILCGAAVIISSVAFSQPARTHGTEPATGKIEGHKYDTRTSAGAHFEGYVKVAESRELYVDFERPVTGRPVIVLLNGLTYRIGYWDSFVRHLRGKGYGILRYDPAGMGRTLLRYAPATQIIPVADQAADLNELLAQLKITQPVHLVGLSYGGALGMKFAHDYPGRVANLIMMAPFVSALESQDTWIKKQIQQNRIWFPYNPASDDELYDYFLRQIIYATYPAVEPVVLENPFKLEGIFRLVQGIRRFLAKDIAAKLPAAHTHLMIARRDQYLDNSIHDEFWNQMPDSVRTSRLYIEHSEHKIPEAVPKFSAAWVLRIVDGDPVISAGRTFVGDPRTDSIVEVVEAPTPAKLGRD